MCPLLLGSPKAAQSQGRCRSKSPIFLCAAGPGGKEAAMPGPWKGRAARCPSVTPPLLAGVGDKVQPMHGSQPGNHLPLWEVFYKLCSLGRYSPSTLGCCWHCLPRVRSLWSLPSRCLQTLWASLLSWGPGGQAASL